MIRQDIDEKWKRTMMTPTGVKIIRIQPSLNYDSLHKYQNRSEIQSLESTSTPVTPRTSGRAATRNGSRAGSAKSSTSRTEAARPGEMFEKPPSPVRPASSRSCPPSATFNSRSRSCQPTHMYMKDDLRRVAKLNRPASHVHSCSQSSVSTEEKPRQPRSPRRFDGTVVNLPKFVQDNEFLTHEDLSMGQKQYIWGIARIYSMSNLMDLKQRQYQSLLDHDFHRNMQDNKLKENERLRERREYQRYTKFIKRYEQRIPRAATRQSYDSASPCKEVSHIHRHVIKGWTTNPHSDEAYRPVKGRRESKEESDERRPDGTGHDDDNEPLSGHYRLVIVKTPLTKNDEQETNVSNEKIEMNMENGIHMNPEQLSEGKESNYL